MENAGGSGGDRILRRPTRTVAVPETGSRTGTVGNTSIEGELDSPAIVKYGDVLAVRKRSHVRGLEQRCLARHCVHDTEQTRHWHVLICLTQSGES